MKPTFAELTAKIELKAEELKKAWSELRRNYPPPKNQTWGFTGKGEIGLFHSDDLEGPQIIKLKRRRSR